jgi:hypothetical protein
VQQQPQLDQHKQQHRLKVPKPQKPALNTRPWRFRAVQTRMEASGELQQQQ